MHSIIKCCRHNTASTSCPYFSQPSSREYDHFAKDCPTTKVEKETHQIQQMFNLDEEQTSLKLLVTDTCDSLNYVHLLEEIKSEHLNL